MVMTFKGADRSGLLDTFPPHDNSLAGMLKGYSTLHDGIHKALGDHLTNTKPPYESAPLYKPVEDLFNTLLDEWELNDSNVVKWLYEDTDRKKKVQDLFGLTNAAAADTLVSSLNTGREVVVKHIKSITTTLAQTSFLETYYYKDGAKLLYTTKATLNEDILEKRVGETGTIMLGAVIANQETFFSAAYLISHMHTHRFNTWKRKDTEVRLYNLGSVAFTLLTFAYLPAKELGSSLESGDVQKYYFFWKVFGSLMGLPDGLIPDNHIQAAELYGLMKEQSGQYGLSEEGLALKATFSKVFESN